MIRLAISVEGQTEESFVRGVLAECLHSMGVFPSAVLLGRARGRKVGGGGVDASRLVSEMARLSYSHDAVTSLVDFYGFRGKENRTVEELEGILAQEMATRVSNPGRVFPYVQKHEFEGLLFSDPTAFGATGRATGPSIEKLMEIRREFDSPEDINDDPAGAPSKRIERIVRGYRKALHGPEVARKTGLKKIRAECPRFDAWLARLEDLGSPGTMPAAPR